MAGQKKGRRKELDHVGAYNFSVEIDGVQQGRFKSVEGIQREMEMIEYKNSDDPLTRKRPGRQKYSDITLKRGFINTPFLEDWWKQVVSGKGTAARSISIVLYSDSISKEVCRWNLYGCWPRIWKTGGFDGKGNDTFTEEIVFCTEYMERKPSNG